MDARRRRLCCGGGAALLAALTACGRPDEVPRPDPRRDRVPAPTPGVVPPRAAAHR